MKEYDWDELKEKSSILYFGMGTSRAIFTLMKRIEEQDKRIHYLENKSGTVFDFLDKL